MTRTFSEFLRETARGRTHDELGQALAELVRAVTETGKRGTLTLTIGVEPFDKTTERTVSVKEEIKVKLPEHDRPRSIFFADGDGNLTHNDPDQLPLELADALSDVKAIRVVETGGVS